jgi:outer membrane protein
MQLAQKRYQATAKSTQASNLAYDYANEKFKAGIMNSLEFETAKNRKISAEANEIQAKYDLFFKKLILDYYETGELKF